MYQNQLKTPSAKPFQGQKRSILRLHDGAKKTLKGDVEGETEKENQEEDVDLTPHEHERALKGAYKSFVMSGVPKIDVDRYFDQTKPHIKTLIKNQLKEMGSAKIIMTLWVRWKKAIMPLIELDPEDAKNTQNVDRSTGYNHIRVEMPFNSLMAEFFEGSNINDLMQGMLAHIKTQVENHGMPESGFSLDKIMYLYINFHRLALTRGGSYTELPKWLKSKKALINLQKKDEGCFKCAVIAALHHKEIKKYYQRISRLRPYENQHYWKGIEFPVSIKKIYKFEKNNPCIAVNVLFSNKKSQDIYKTRRSGRNVKCEKQVNLLMIADGEKRHYTAIKSISRLSSKLNEKTKRAYHYCMNCLNGFRTGSARDKHCEYCSSNGHAKVNMPNKKEKWLKFHDGQYQFMLPFMLHAYFESILKPVDEWYMDKMNRMKTARKGKASYTENINRHVPSGCCVYTTIAYGEVPDL